MDNYDPGDLYDEDAYRARRRRRYGLDNSEDDNWALADEDDIPDDQVDIEDLASGYIYDHLNPPDPPPGRQSDIPETPSLGPLPPSAQRLAGRGRTVPRQERVQQRFNRSQAYANSPSYRRNRQNPVDRLFSFLGLENAPDEPATPQSGGMPAGHGPLGNVPFWGILILVVLVFMAVLVTIFACVAAVAFMGG